MLIAEHNGKALEVKDSSPAIGASIIAASPPNGAPNQIWQIIESK